MLPLKRKSVEPIAAHVGPQAVSAKHQSLLHFVGNSRWSDEAMLHSVHDYVMEHVPEANGMDAPFLKRHRGAKVEMDSIH